MSTVFPGDGNNGNNQQPHGHQPPQGQQPNYGQQAPYGGPQQDPNNPYGAPYNGQPGYQPAPPEEKKKGGCLKWGLIIGGVLLVLAVLSSLMGDSEDSTSTDSLNEDVASENQPGDDANSEEEFKGEDSKKSNEDAELTFGQEADLKGFKITADNIRDDGMDALNSNHVCADVSIQNDSEKEVDVNPFDFNLTTPAGITVDVDFTTSSNLQSAAVNPGGNLAGTVCFKSDAAPGDYKLGYEPTFALRKAFWNGQL